MKITGHFFCETWRFDLTLVCGCKRKAVARFLKRETGDRYEPPRKEFDGHAVGTTVGSYIFLREKWTDSTEQLSSLSHEAGHIAEWILWTRGVAHNEETREAWAYLHAMIFRRCLRILRKEKDE